MPKPNHHVPTTSISAAAGGPMDSVTSYRGGLGHRSKTKIKKGKQKDHWMVPAVYDVNANIEEEYRLFLKNVRVHKNEDFVLEYDDKVIRYGGEAMADGCGCREVRMKEREKVVEVVVISSDDESTKSVLEPNALDSGSSRQKVMEDQEKMDEKNEVALPLKGNSGPIEDEEKMDEKNEVALPLKGNSGPIEDVEKVITIQVEDVWPQIMLALPKLGTTTSLTNPNDGHETEPHTTSQSPGIIWPTHINDREESDFKQGLIEALSKPFCQGEYDKLYGMATIREPSMRERRTRSGAKTYHSYHSMGKSYFDCYPDLAEQVEETSCPNRLALLRGLFYWLENVGKEQQFRPWRNEHRRYKVIHF